MGDFFDLNNDGKIDNFEGAMRWDMIDHMTGGASSHSGSSGYRRTSYSSSTSARFAKQQEMKARQEFTMGVIDRAMEKDADVNTRKEALRKCREVLAEDPPELLHGKFSKWYVIGAVIGILDLMLGILVKDPVVMIGAFALWWFFSLPGIQDNKWVDGYNARQRREYSQRQAFAQEYADKLEEMLKEE